MKRNEILEAARKCVCEDRDKQYGNPEDNFGKIAELWSAYRGELFLKRDVAMMLALVKIARIYAGESIDSYVDLAGYAACGGEIATENRSSDKADSEKSEIAKISYKYAKRMLKMGKGHMPKGKFYFNNGHMWIGIDNSTDEMWMEDFITEDGCIAWLKGDGVAVDYEDELKK